MVYVPRTTENSNAVDTTARVRVKATSRGHLADLVAGEMHAHGPQCNLNHIDVAGITDMDRLFWDLDFQGDISEWDVSQVTTMRSMFRNAPFDGDLSKWNTCNVENMQYMFENSHFRGNLAHWNVAKVKTMEGMFRNAANTSDVSAWNIASGTDTTMVFFENETALLCQTPCLWNIPCFLEGGLVPKDMQWREAFERALPIAESLGLGLQESAALIAQEYDTFHTRGQHATLPDHALEGLFAV